MTYATLCDKNKE